MILEQAAIRESGSPVRHFAKPSPFAKACAPAKTQTSAAQKRKLSNLAKERNLERAAIKGLPSWIALLVAASLFVPSRFSEAENIARHSRGGSFPSKPLPSLGNQS